jgi:hypothetical protein
VTEGDPILGPGRGPVDACLDSTLIRRFAAATRDPSPAVLAGEAVPPVALVTQIWAALDEARTALLRELEQTCTTGLHGEHDIVLHRPLQPGEPLRILVHGQGARPAGPGCVVTLRYSALDARAADSCTAGCPLRTDSTSNGPMR